MRAKATPVPAYALYGEALSAPDEACVHVETIAARSLTHAWSIEAHRHRDLQQLLWVQSGAVVARLDDETVALRGPCVVAVPPGSVHAFRFDSGTRGLVASFAAGRLEALSAQTPALRGLLERPAAVALDTSDPAVADLAGLSAMLLREFERPPAALARACAVGGLLAALLATACRALQAGAAPAAAATARDRELVANFRAAAEREFRRHLHLPAYCRALRVSPARLRRACHGVTGSSPTALLHSRMLLEAERQLRYTALAVNDVAAYLGFADPAYFTRFFKRGVGVSPSTFRARASA